MRRRFQADLNKLKNGVKACADRITSSGLAEDAVAPLVRVAAGITASLPELDPLVGIENSRRLFPAERSEHNHLPGAVNGLKRSGYFIDA